MSVKYPTPETAGPGSAVIFVVFQDTSPVEPKPAAVPEFEIVAPLGIVKVSPLSPRVTVVPDLGLPSLLAPLPPPPAPQSPDTPPFG